MKELFAMQTDNHCLMGYTPAVAAAADAAAAAVACSRSFFCHLFCCSTLNQRPVSGLRSKDLLEPLLCCSTMEATSSPARLSLPSGASWRWSASSSTTSSSPSSTSRHSKPIGDLVSMSYSTSICACKATAELEPTANQTALLRRGVRLLPPEEMSHSNWLHSHPPDSVLHMSSSSCNWGWGGVGSSHRCWRSTRVVSSS
mmetsp:Transcript_16002/g.48046  ORF Transcript_16002/g.48046 Transcript_16002/m.48046 type:complete len:200 (+) Transcript_16002:313-912(+)